MGTVLRPLYIYLAYLSFIPTDDSYYYPHFRDKDTESLRGCVDFWRMHVVCGGSRIWTQEVWFQILCYESSQHLLSHPPKIQLSCIMTMWICHRHPPPRKNMIHFLHCLLYRLKIYLWCYTACIFFSQGKYSPLEEHTCVLFIYVSLVHSKMSDVF